MAEDRLPGGPAEVEQQAALRAAIQMGIDDIAAGRFEDIDDVRAWAQGIADEITTHSVA